jgi:hypothetical protein
MVFGMDFSNTVPNYNFSCFVQMLKMYKTSEMDIFWEGQKMAWN